MSTPRSASGKQPLLERLAHVIVRRRRAVIGLWVVLTLFGAFSAGQVSKRWFESFSIPGYSSYEANQRTLKAFGTGEQPPLVAVFHSSGDITKEAGIEKAVAGAAKVNPGSRVSSYCPTGSRRLCLEGRAHDLRRDLPGRRRPSFTLVRRTSRKCARGMKAATPAGVQANLTGRDPLYEARPAAAEGPSVLTEALIGGLGCLVILFFVFGTLPAVLIPLAIAVASILNTFTLVWLLTYVTDVSIIVQFLIALVGLGVAIDYALLMIFRFRDELREGEDVETALVETMTHAGRSVIVSGSTVAVGLLSMVLLPLPFIRSIGIGGMLIPAVSVITAITLLPALLATLGTRINSRPRAAEALRRPRPSRETASGDAGRASSCAARCRSPLIGLAIVGAARLHGVQLNPSEAQAKDFPGKGDAIDGRERARRRGHLGRRDEAVRRARRERRRPARRSRVKLRRDARCRRSRGAAAPDWRKGPNSLVEAFPDDRRREPSEARSTIKRVARRARRARAAPLGGVAAEDRDFVARRLLELPVRARASSSS